MECIITSDEDTTFTWKGKKDAILEAHTETPYILRECEEESVNFGTTENLYIEGDNLDVLKLLQNEYFGGIKMIYIDPPYNTGNDFVYKDSGKSHSDWLNMMYPRLKLARNLLTDDGVIFISIDDNEVVNLKKICDEVFGEENFIEMLKWKRKKQPSFLAKHTAKLMEYILVYSKNSQSLEKLSIEGTSDSTRAVINISNKESIRSFKSGVLVKLDGSGCIKKGCYLIKTMEVEYLEDVFYADGKTTNKVRVLSKFSESQINIDKFIDEGLLFITKQNGLRRYVSEEEKGKRKSITDLLLNDWGDNQESAAEQYELFGVKLFDYTKPVQLLSNLVKCNNTESNIILDFFSGSATTAHAVMKLNAEDSGNRKFIMVQLPEEIDNDEYRNICEIGKERIRRAGKKIAEDNNKVDIGFKVLKLHKSRKRYGLYR